MMIELFLHLLSKNVHPPETARFCFICFQFRRLRERPWRNGLPPTYTLVIVLQNI